MYFEDKVKMINDCLMCIEKDKNVLIWGTGRHTDELLKNSMLTKFNNITFVDIDSTRGGNLYFGVNIIHPNDIEFESISYIIVSSYKFQTEIKNEIIQRGFKGKIITFYNEDDNGDFYRLPKHKSINYIVGSYGSWEDAKEDSKGYDDKVILDKVFKLTSKYNITEGYIQKRLTDYTWFLLTIIGVVASYKNKINVLDFGGALGTTYWKNQDILTKFQGKEMNWTIIDQPHFVKLGQEKIQNNRIRFVYDFKDIDDVDIVLFSGVLMYLNKTEYENVIMRTKTTKARFIVVDRQLVGCEEKICVQKVSDPNYYTSSYPIRVMRKETLINDFGDLYELIAECSASTGNPESYIDAQKVERKCFIFEKV